MSGVEPQRARKEAADAVTSRRPSPSDGTASALRRYLGIEMFQTLRETKKDGDPKPSSSDDESG